MRIRIIRDLLFILLLFFVSNFSFAVSQEKYDDIALLSRVLSFVDKQYVDEVKTEKLVYGAIKGMLEALDPHSAFLSPEIYRQMKNETAGKFGGIGIEIWLGKDGFLTVVQPIEGTPAWKEGIKAGDKIIKINGENTKGLSLVEAVAKMRGKSGETLRLSIYREGSEDLLEFKIVRSEIKLKSVKSTMLDKNYGYIKLNHFQEKSSKELKKSLAKMEKKNRLKGLILDLRNNPGGLLDQAIEIANLFIDDGVIVFTKGRGSKKLEEKKARSGVARKTLPLAVLVNGNSASAAEIVAGAIKDHRRGLVLGSRTFGKGSVQTVIPLSKDVGIKLTVARYYTPKGTSIQETGIVPDIALEEVDDELFAKAKVDPEYIREVDLKGHFSHEKGDGKRYQKIREFSLKTKDKKKRAPKQFNPKEDYQVKQALRFLKGYDLFENLRHPVKQAVK